MADSRWLRLRPFVFAVGCVGAATAARAAADPWLGRSVPYLLYYPAVMIAAWYAGFWPAVMAALLSAGAATYLYLAPVSTIATRASGEMVALALFVVNGIVVARLGEYMRRAALDQQKLSSIVESSDDAIVGKDLDGVITSWNRGAERLFGYGAHEVIGRPISMIIPPDRLGEEQHVLESIRAGRRIEPFETIRLRKDGTIVPVSMSVSPIVDRAGAIVGASKIARDISERRRAETQRQELLERERLAHEEAVAARDRLAFLAEVGALLTSSLDYEETLDRAVHIALPRLGDYCSVFVQDDHGELRHVAWGHVVREKESVLRELAARMLAAPSRLGFPTFAERVMKSAGTVVVDHQSIAQEIAAHGGGVPADILRLGLQLQPYAYVGAPLLVRGRVIGVLSFGTSEQESRREYAQADVELIEEFARRVALAVENARLFRHAGELNRLKDEFLATLSHELRTPLAAVLGWSRMLASGHLDAQRATQAIQAIERNAQAQSKIVDDILDVARGMSGNLRLDLAPIDLVSVAQRGVEAIAPAAQAKNIHLDVRAGAPVPVTGDAGRLQQVVWNLLANAVKFTPPGGRVTIEVAADDGQAELRVTDTGVGIPQTFLPFVFDKFRQADGSFSRQYGGLGLGLAIARHLIELHGGSIEARSAGEGAGATFVVRLPGITHAA